MATLLVKPEKVESVFRKVAEILEARDLYCLPNGHSASIEDLQYAIEQKYGLKIEKVEVQFDSDFVRGAYERYADGRVRILVRSEQEKSFLRFTTVKELAHAIIDEVEDWSPKGETTVKHLITSARNSGILEGPAELNSEKLAECAAIELLMPFDLRRNDHELVKKGGQTIASLGMLYDVPSSIVEMAISDWYLKLAEKYWEIVRPGDEP